MLVKSMDLEPVFPELNLVLPLRGFPGSSEGKASACN